MYCVQAVARTLVELQDLLNRMAALDVVVKQVSSCNNPSSCLEAATHSLDTERVLM